MMRLNSPEPGVLSSAPTTDSRAALEENAHHPLGSFCRFTGCTESPPQGQPLCGQHLAQLLSGCPRPQRQTDSDRVPAAGVLTIKSASQAAAVPALISASSTPIITSSDQPSKGYRAPPPKKLSHPFLRRKTAANGRLPVSLTAGDPFFAKSTSAVTAAGTTGELATATVPVSPLSRSQSERPPSAPPRSLPGTPDGGNGSYSYGTVPATRPPRPSSSAADAGTRDNPFLVEDYMGAARRAGRSGSAPAFQTYTDSPPYRVAPHKSSEPRSRYWLAGGHALASARGSAGRLEGNSHNNRSHSLVASDVVMVIDDGSDHDQRPRQESKARDSRPAVPSRHYPRGGGVAGAGAEATTLYGQGVLRDAPPPDGAALLQRAKARVAALEKEYEASLTVFPIPSSPMQVSKSAATRRQDGLAEAVISIPASSSAASSTIAAATNTTVTSNTSTTLVTARRCQPGQDRRQFSLDQHIYSQPGAAFPPRGISVPTKPGLAAGGEAGDAAVIHPHPGDRAGYVYAHMDPRVHWTRPRSEKWHAAKQKQIKERGGRKANFGKAAQRRATQLRAEAAAAARGGTGDSESSDSCDCSVECGSECDSSGSGNGSGRTRSANASATPSATASGGNANGNADSTAAAADLHDGANAVPPPAWKRRLPPEISENEQWMELMAIFVAHEAERRAMAARNAAGRTAKAPKGVL